MKRRALIIGNPGEAGAENYCDGVKRDLANYSQFLKSPLGGGWYEYEITIADRPSVADIRTQIAEAQLADYSFIAFCGHGYISGRTSSTILELRRGQEIDSAELRTGAPRHSLILDCCRKISAKVIAEDHLMKAVMARADADARESRKYFDKALSECPTGLAVLHACSVNEVAGDDSRAGGYYSSSLFLASRSWMEEGDFDNTKYHIFPIVRAHSDAYERVGKLSGGRQHPTIEKPRSEPYFPFAIVA